MKLLPAMLMTTFLILLFSCSNVEQRQIKNKWIQDKWIGEFVDGWDEMTSYLNNYSKDPINLSGKKFELKVNLDGEWDLIVFPIQGFEVKRKGNANQFEAFVVNPKSLYETSGGISRLTLIQAELKKIGGDKGTIDLTPQTDCLFKIKFIQKNKKPVDFDRLLERYDYEFVISPSNDVEVYSVTPEYVTLKRVGDKTREAFLRLLLVDKKTKETFYSNEVDIPECGYKKSFSIYANKKKYFEVKDAGQCIRHIKSHGKQIDATKVHMVFQKEEFYNMCPHPVSCQLTAKYGYIKDKKIVDADTKVYKFSVKPESLQSIDTSWNYINQQFNFDAKIYIATTASKSSFPKNYKNNEMPGFLECKFE